MVSNQDCLSARAAQKLVNDPNYDIDEYVGKGAMACVYRATERGTPNVYAMKLLRERYRTDTQFIDFFKREAVSMRDLQYPNIVRFYTYSIQDDYAYILMDYVDGFPLTKIISQARRSGEMIPLDMIIVTMAQIARAISYLHRQKYVHRDIKPGNVLLQENNAAYLTDLGIAGLVTAQDDDIYLGAGTPSYMPYEQQTFRKIDHTADIYAFGITMYEMFTAKKPFLPQAGLDVKEARKQMVELHRQAPLTSLLEKRPELPPEIDSFFERALAKKPHERYQDVMDFAKDVHEALVKADLIPASLHDFDMIDPPPIPQASSVEALQGDAEVPYPEKPKRILPNGNRNNLLQILGAIVFGALLTLLAVFFVFSQFIAQDEATATPTETDVVTQTALVTESSADNTAVQAMATDPLPTETDVADFFAEGALVMLSLDGLINDNNDDDNEDAGLTDAMTALRWILASEGQAVIPFEDGVAAFEVTLTLDTAPTEDRFSYGIAYGEASILVMGADDRLTLRIGDELLETYTERGQLPQAVTVRAREDALQIETVSFDDTVAIYDVANVVMPIDEVRVIFTDLLPDAQLDMLSVSVTDEDITLASLPALDIMQYGVQALRRTGTAREVITCASFVDVYDAIQSLRTAEGVTMLLTTVERINGDVREACEAETTVTADLGWADEMDALIEGFSP